MLHPRLTPVGDTIGGSTSVWLHQIGPYGAWSDLATTTRWGSGASGMFEASWNMALPPGFTDPLFRRGTIVELMAGGLRVGSPLVLSEPSVGLGLSDPWQFVATGVGREVEGDSSWLALDGSGNSTNDAAVAIDQAILRGLPWSRDAGGWPAALGTETNLESIGALLNRVTNASGVRWLVNQGGTVVFSGDPTTPKYHVTPGSAQLGTADDDYASVVFVRYINSTSHAAATVYSPASTADVETRYGRREFPVDLTGEKGPGEISAATAQGFADGIYAKSKGRLAWTNSLTLTSNDILTSGGVPASLSKVLEDVGTGCMVRLHGIFDDLLEFTGNTYLDIIVGQAKYTDGDQAIQLDPLGLAPRDLAAVVESITGMAA